jgi:hypothetical protein
MRRRPNWASRVRNAEQFILPQLPRQSTVVGEAQNATLHGYRPNRVRDDYKA